MKLSQQQVAELIQRYRNDPMAFAADLFVPLGGKSGRLGDHWADFQQRDFAALAPSLVAVANGETPPTRRFWIERTKGGSKDSDCCVAILWLLAFASRTIRIQVGAYDQEQASELRHIAKAILNIDAPLNRLLASRIEVQRNCIIGKALTPGTPESVCEILTTDAYGAHGARPDVVIANELSHVGSQAFMETLFDNADKVPHSICIVATNAGERGTWQEKWREIAETSGRWCFSVLDKPAPWVGEADLAESQLRNPPQRFARLWRGVWSSGDGDTIPPEQIAACTILDGPHSYAKPGMVYLAGVDLGIKRDHSAIVIVGFDFRRDLVELAAVRSWSPRMFASQQVELSHVQDAILDAQRRFRTIAWVFDPWNCALLAEQCSRQGCTMIECAMTSAQKNIMAKTLIESFANKLVALYPDEEFARDLGRLRFKENSIGGLQISAIRDSTGHADKATAFAIVLPYARALSQDPDATAAHMGNSRVDDAAEVLTPV
ncbi:MAG: hypothetical protein U0805_01945 [Pirellulales bacterium]